MENIVKNILTIRWATAENPSRPTYISAHNSAEDARGFIDIFRKEHPDMRLEINIGNKQGVVGAAHRLPVESTQTNLPLIQALEREGSVLIPIDRKNPSPFLENYHSVRGAFARHASLPIEVLHVENDRPNGHRRGPAQSRM